jgi:LytS/YehU family sensor histidine kinase
MLARAAAQPDHIGLTNTAKRLLLAYGERCSIDLSSSSAGGTEVRIRIPREEPRRASDGRPAAASGGPQPGGESR